MCYHGHCKSAVPVLTHHSCQTRGDRNYSSDVCRRIWAQTFVVMSGGGAAQRRPHASQTPNIHIHVNAPPREASSLTPHLNLGSRVSLARCFVDVGSRHVTSTEMRTETLLNNEPAVKPCGFCGLLVSLDMKVFTLLCHDLAFNI